MAVVRVYGITEDRPGRGGRIVVRDDAYAGLGRAELERIRTEVALAIRRADYAAQAARARADEGEA